MLLDKQAEILTKQALYPSEALFNIGAIIDIRGPFDEGRMREADRAVKRDPALRSALSVTAWEPEIITLDDHSTPLEVLDLSGHDDPFQSAISCIDQRLQQTFPFDGKTALLRHTLIRIAKDHHLMVGFYHHLAYDGWATSLIYQRLAAFYNGTAQGEFGSSVLPLSLQEQFNAEREYKNSRLFATDQTYWQARLTGYDTTLFPQGCREVTARRHSFTVEPHHRDKLQALALSSGGTLFQALTGITATFLFRTFGVDDIVLGLPVLNRRSARAKQTCGLFANVLPFRLQRKSRDTFSSLLKNINALLKADYRHQRFPANQLLRGGVSYEASLSYEKHDYSAAYEGTDTRLTVLSSPSQDYPLKIFIRDYDAERPLTIDIDYNVSAFSEIDIERVFSDFENILDNCIAFPERELFSSSQITPAKAAFAQPTVTDDLCTQFELAATRYAGRVAISCDGQQLTYAELDQAANALAWRLRERGIGAGQQESLVGLSVERGPGLLVGILGILKAGGAYVPLDPVYPAERLSFLVADSGIRVVVADEAGLTAMAGQDVQRVGLATEGINPTGEEARDARLSGSSNRTNEAAPPRSLHPQQAAYVIYTSGSTGQPKGCVVTHANVSRLFTATAHYEFGESDVWTLFHSYAFDFSVWEIWGALLHGGRLVVVPYLSSRDPEQFALLLEEEAVTVLSQTPAAFRQLVAASARQTFPALRLVFFGGEALEPGSLRPWYARHGERVRLVNMYGITETTVHVTEYALCAADSEKPASAIGEPLADLHVQVLDRYGEPVQAGVTGEMYVGGAGVTRGYLGRAALTAQRFVPDPWGSPGSRLYRSGDLARRLADGNLIYQGRADQQLKLRGFRIEPGEIEAALREEAGVRDAAVLLDTPEQGQPRLVAYVVGGENSQALREALSARLPAHMVPAVIMPLAQLPLTAHGKLDRRALPKPEIAVADGAGARNEVEQTLARIWSEVLNIPEPGIDENFFALGGDSINSLQVIAKARAAGINVTIEGFLAAQYIRKIAAGVKNNDTASNDESLTSPFSLLSASDRALLPDNVDDAFPLSRLQAGMLFHSTLAEEGAIFHDVFTFRLRMPWDEQAWRHALERLPSFHTPLRTSFHWTGYSEPIQIIHSSAEIAYQIIDLRPLATEQREREIAAFIAESKSYHFEPAVGRMFRVSLHRHTDEELQLTLDFHHAIFDGWSVATLLSSLIHSVTNADASVAQTLSDTSANTAFVALERQAEADQHLIETWRKRVSDVAPTLLGRDVSGEAATATRQVRRKVFRLPDPLANQLKQRATDLAIPLKIVLLTAHLSALAKISGGAVTTSGYVTHGRTAGADKAVGLFLNTLPFSVALPPASWRELTELIAAEERGLQSIRRLPAAVIKSLNSGMQLYNVSFNYIHFHIYGGLLDLPDFQVVDVDIYEETDFPLLAQYSQDPFDGSLEITLVSDPAVVADWQVEQFGEFVMHAVEAIANRPDTRWYASLQPKTVVPHSENSVKAVFDLCTLFELAATRYADRVAVSSDGQQLTYAELDRAANALAWRLRERGIGAGQQESLVGLSVERGPGLLVGILGILKAGGAYVPLDPVYPAERLSFLTANSGVRVVVADEAGLTAMAGQDVQRVGLAEGVSQTNAASAGVSPSDSADPAHNAPPRSLHPQQAAYVIYTSGSTGQPKGCVVTHANVTRLFSATAHYAFSESDVWTLFHSYAFDFSVWEIWGALLHGGRLVVVPYLSSRDPEQFALLLEEEAVTVLSQTPAAFRQLVAASARQTFPALRLVFFGGEALEPGSLRPWYARHGERVRLVNMYGITETTVHVTEHTLPAASVDQPAGAIGEALADLHVQVLDRYGEPVPLGVAGEMYVGGAGVTRGYLGRAALTAQRFVPDPWGAPGSRLYRSGDLARRLADGNLIYQGRADQQLKLRGFRIEPGEIEAALREETGVRDAAVLLDTPEQGQPRLVAYVVGGDNPQALREALSKRLPEHMVPAVIMPLAQLPLTAHGKLDRRALPKPEIALRSNEEGYQSTLEKEIAGLLGSVLGLSGLGRHQSFLETGGDSILATQALFRLRERYGVELPLRHIFEAGTVAALAEKITALRQINNGERQNTHSAPLLPSRRRQK
ncbi:non-ribosomal peptide synthetase [Pantoea sp. CCBC3-3-1]|uniref:non-ribosomal peptide synthetase n=1 Tax=Pantoea sp. CCBC3-3-1 TaxID=2490851 RepID=UPI00143D5435|nr:non-ribosomal peptide synthetase [Pantoea sp. CCBC3-3-1]